MSNIHLSIYQDRPVKVIVGIDSDATTWYIHPVLLTQCSPYFRAALAVGRFTESKSNSVSLPDDDSHAFGTLVQWIYVIGVTKLSIGERDCSNIVKAYCLGDKFGITHFRNDVLGVLARANHPMFNLTHQSVIYTFEHTLKGSALRIMLTDMIATSIQDGAIKLDENTVRSPSNGSADLTWSELSEGGGEYVSAVLSKFVGGDTVRSRTTKTQYYVECVLEGEATAGKP